MRGVRTVVEPAPSKLVESYEVTVSVKQGESTITDPATILAMKEANGMTLRGPWPWIASLEVVFEDFEVCVRGWLDVPDRDDPKTTKRVLTMTRSQLEYKPIREIIRDAVRTIVLHELDESLYWFEERTFDPHLRKP